MESGPEPKYTSKQMCEQQIRDLRLKPTDVARLRRRAYQEAAAILREADIETSDLCTDEDGIMEYFVRYEIADELHKKVQPPVHPRKQCGATHATRSGLVFCVKDTGHKGKHKGFRKTW